PEPPPPAPILRKSPSPSPDIGITITDYPKVDGSTPTQPLQMIVACKLLGADSTWYHDSRDDTRKRWAIRYDKQTYLPIPNDPLCDRINRLVRSRGTSEAYTN